jgi:hypothetical protein
VRGAKERHDVGGGDGWVGWEGVPVTDGSPQAPPTRSSESMAHWRTLRESLERSIQGLESDLSDFRWNLSRDIAAYPMERRYERLLRLRRLHAKLGSRERLTAAEAACSAQPACE